MTTGINVHEPRAIVIGSSGGIGAALTQSLSEQGFKVTGLARSRNLALTDEVAFDITNEASIAAAADALQGEGPFALILVATGLLHDQDVMPEKSLNQLDQTSLTRLFAINAVGPALVAKHFVPLLPRHGRCIFAVLSARVGSISDNRLGGWYGYRASKAALNMFIKTLAVEVGRTREEAICVALHPGTVDTDLSKPFQKYVAPDRLFSPKESALHLLKVVEQLTPDQSGGCFAWDGAEIRP